MYHGRKWCEISGIQVTSWTSQWTSFWIILVSHYLCFLIDSLDCDVAGIFFPSSCLFHKLKYPAYLFFLIMYKAADPALFRIVNIANFFVFLFGLSFLECVIFVSYGCYSSLHIKSRFSFSPSLWNLIRFTTSINRFSLFSNNNETSYKFAKYS